MGEPVARIRASGKNIFVEEGISVTFGGGSFMTALTDYTSSFFGYRLPYDVNSIMRIVIEDITYTIPFTEIDDLYIPYFPGSGDPEEIRLTFKDLVTSYSK